MGKYLKRDNVAKYVAIFAKFGESKNARKLLLLHCFYNRDVTVF